MIRGQRGSFSKGAERRGSHSNADMLASMTNNSGSFNNKQGSGTANGRRQTQLALDKNVRRISQMPGRRVSQLPQDFSPTTTDDVKRMSIVAGKGDAASRKRSSFAMKYGSGVDLEVYEEYKWMLRPNSSLRLAWDIWVMVLLIYVALMAPFRLGFNADATGSLLYLEYGIDLNFILDIFINFRTGYFDSELDVEVMDPKRSALNYFQSWFLVDVISSIPFDLISSFSGVDSGGGDIGTAKLLKTGKFVKAFRLLRITKLLKFMKGSIFAEQFDDWVHMSASRHTLRMVKLLVMTGFVSHINCCFWAGVGMSAAVAEESWIYMYQNGDYGMDENSLSSQYITSMYWSIQTMTTVGYGDIVARNDLERCYSVFSMILGGGYYGFIVATMASLVSNLDANAKSYYEKMDNVTSYMKKRKFPKILFRKMRKYYKHYFDTRTALNEDEILDELSLQLRTEVALFLIHDDIYNIDLFENLTPEMLAKILTALKPLQVSRKEMVCVAGDIGREMYILINGEMTVEDVNGKIVSTLRGGDYFGELSALDINPINLTTVTATQNCELYSLSKEKLNQAFSAMPEVLNHMKDIVLEKAIILYKLDADVNAENDDTLNMFFEKQTKLAIEYKDSHFMGEKVAVEGGGIKKAEGSDGKVTNEAGKHKNSSVSMRGIGFGRSNTGQRIKEEEEGGGGGGGGGNAQDAKRSSVDNSSENNGDSKASTPNAKRSIVPERKTLHRDRNASFKKDEQGGLVDMRSSFATKKSSFGGSSHNLLISTSESDTNASPSHSDEMHAMFMSSTNKRMDNIETKLDQLISTLSGEKPKE